MSKPTEEMSGGGVDRKQLAGSIVNLFQSQDADERKRMQDELQTLRK